MTPALRVFGGAAAALLGVVLALLGLLFLLGSKGQAYRLAIGAGCLALGALAIGAGLRLVRSGQARSPEALAAAIAAAAAARNGELSSAQLLAALGARAPYAQPVLERLLAEGRCQRQVRAGESWYVFAGLQPRLIVLVCQHCQAEQDLSSGLRGCPTCGGPLVERVRRVSLAAGASYGMDEPG